MVEAVLDFSDEDDVGEMPDSFTSRLRDVLSQLDDWLAQPRARSLREGFKVVLAGPPNAGKSTLFNALVAEEAAITSPIEGTTRDVLMRSVDLAGIPFQFLDTAGLKEQTDDVIESIGIDRARDAAEAADIVLWLGPEGEGPAGCWEIEAKADVQTRAAKRAPRHRLSALSGDGIAGLVSELVKAGQSLVPKPGAAALSDRQHRLLAKAREGLAEADRQNDLLLIAEGLRLTRQAFDELVGRSGTEDMLDALFGRFCIGK